MYTAPQINCLYHVAVCSMTQQDSAWVHKDKASNSSQSSILVPILTVWLHNLAMIRRCETSEPRSLLYHGSYRESSRLNFPPIYYLGSKFPQ